MEWLGWIIAGLLGVVLGILAWRQRRVALSFIQERARIERRSRSDAASIRKQAVEAAEQLRADAERALEQAKEWAHEAGADIDRRREELEASIATQRAELREQRSAQERQEERLNEKEDRLAAEAEGLATRSELLEQQRTDLRKQREELAAEQGRVQMELERVAGLTANAAQAEVMAEAARQARLSAATLARDIEETAKKEADQRARAIVVTAIQRCAAEQTSESVVSSVDLPGDEMKGRIIGREGRNIRAFEQITGVNVMVDDTPETVLLSCFDPVRREAARLTLMDLVADGQTWTNRSILAEFLKTRQANPNAVIVNTSEWSVFDVGGWWVTLSGELYATADEANAWCDSQGYDSEHCLAKRMESSGSPQGTTKSR